VKREVLTLGPVLDVLDVLIGVLQIVQDVLGVGVEEVWLWSAALLHRHAPGAMLDAGGEVAGKGVGIRGRQIHVIRSSRAVIRVERVHGLDFAGVGIHTSSRLTGLDVTPDHRRCDRKVSRRSGTMLGSDVRTHISFIVHETCVEVGRLVRVG
jgi:hypothetical protein